ncbi:MAG TPA: hypothetical protein VI796_04515 [Candidatus Thermoplasmatota archaeon]|nr:hypothetical protein [Candidatus Thermoplasmatota archaeon]
MADLPMVALAALFIATPALLAVAVDIQVRAFQREAFGHLQKAARWFRLMTFAVLLYYFGVLAASLYAGDLQGMLEFPVPREALAIYVRIGAATLAYALALMVAKELYLVTRPGRMAPGAPADDGPAGPGDPPRQG